MKVSIVIPCYNQAQFLEEALASVLAQTYQDWECIVVNDGSKDETESIATKWLIKDSRFKYLAQENSGVVVARNNGINQATGTYILPLDADDKISKDYLSLAIAKFTKDPKLKVVYSSAMLFGAKEGLWQLPDYSLKQLAERNVIFSSAIYKKADWKRVDGYDINMKEGLEDWEFWINILKGGGEVYKIPEVCFYYRQLDSSRNTSIAKEQYYKLYDYLSLKHTSFFIEQLGSFKKLNDRLLKLERQHLRLNKELEKSKASFSLRTFLEKIKKKLND